MRYAFNTEFLAYYGSGEASMKKFNLMKRYRRPGRRPEAALWYRGCLIRWDYVMERMPKAQKGTDTL